MWLKADSSLQVVDDFGMVTGFKIGLGGGGIERGAGEVGAAGRVCPTRSQLRHDGNVAKLMGYWSS